jgi:hypothetical protein
LLVHVLEDVVDCFSSIAEVDVRFIDCKHWAAIRLCVVDLEPRRLPVLIGRFYSFLNEVAYWFILGHLNRALEEIELHHVTKCVDVVLHLEHHYFTRVVVAVKT